MNRQQARVLVSLGIGAFLALTVACGGGDSSAGTPTATATRTPPPTSTPSPTPQPTSTPLARTVTARGVGETVGTADVAEVTFQVSVWRPGLLEAMDYAEAKRGELVNQLAGLGATRISDAGLNTYREDGPTDLPSGQPRSPGSRVYRYVSGRIPDPDGAGHSIGTLAEGLGPEVSVVATRWELSNPAGARAEARRQAVDDARANAEQMAAQAGLTLGEIVAIEEEVQATDESAVGYYGIGSGVTPESVAVRVTFRCENGGS